MSESVFPTSIGRDTRGSNGQDEDTPYAMDVVGEQQLLHGHGIIPQPQGGRQPWIELPDMEMDDAVSDLPYNFEMGFPNNLAFPNLQTGLLGSPIGNRSVSNSNIFPAQESTDQSGVKPIDWFTSQEESWNASRIGGIPTPTENADFNNYRQPVDRDPSEADSGITSKRLKSLKSDSGYQTARGAQSNMDTGIGGQDETDLQDRLGGLNTFDTRSRSSTQSAVRTGPRSKIASHPCGYCGEVLKSISDYKKHVNRHEKPFKCNFAGCPNAEHGFTTPNDLARHKSSKHKEFEPGSSYWVCAAPGCSSDKAWPRLDNFKHHCKCTHKTLSLDELIENSERIAVGGHTTHPEPSKDELTFAMNVTYQDPQQSLPSPESPSDSRTVGTILRSGPNQNPSFDMSPPNPSQAQNSLSSLPQRDVVPNNLPHLETMSAPDLWQFQRGGNGRANAHTSRTNFMHDQRFLNPRLSDFEYGSKYQAEPTARKTLTTAKPRTKAKQTSRAPKTADKTHPVVHQDQQNQELADLAMDIVATLSKGPQDAQQVIYQMLNDRRSVIGEARKLELDDKAAMNEFINNEISKPMSRRASRSSSPSSDSDLSDTDYQARSTATIKKERKPKKMIPCKHPNCTKQFARHCELKKHTRRHTKPFSCTFDKCKTKNFGSKNDWKRHENSTHFQNSQWRCHLPDANEKELPCATLFPDKAMLLQHMAKEHSQHFVPNSTMVDEKCEIGANHQKQFWCGFCGDGGEIVKLKATLREAWDERFNHIAEHFTTEQKTIDKWVVSGKPWNTKETSTRRKAAVDKDKPGYSQTAESPLSKSAAPNEFRTDGKQAMAMHDDVVTTRRNRRNTASKRTSDGVAKPEPATHSRHMVFCCSCREGPFNEVLEHECGQCSHKFCNGCFHE